jgi:hypothetical protein
MMNYGQKCRSLVFENLTCIHNNLEDTGGALKQWKI